MAIHGYISLLIVLCSGFLGHSMTCCGGTVSGNTAAGAAHNENEPSISFSREIRPILSAKCFQCHGPDENTREADLRLDIAEAAYADLGDYAAIVPHDPNASELIRRVESTEEYEQMPPIDSGKELTQEEIAILRRWVAAGGEYQQHWAFVAPQKMAVQEVGDDSWARNEIDHLVLRELRNRGLSPSVEAGRYSLVRRVYLDLIGLPPSIEQADEFVNDESPDAYERLVDRLLESPHYGERWARRWLDLARYSDTKGYEKDQPRTMWLYRDWVIDALNADMPFDQFTIEQIAGDMLPEATLQQKIATGFHRNTMTNEEGGIDPQEFRYHSIVDRVATTGATWLGLTTGCAQCHTHKFDPITHTEYYQLFAFLNNSDEPKIEIPREKIHQRREAIQQQIERLTADLKNQYPVDDQQTIESESQDLNALRRQALREDFDEWKQQQRKRVVEWRTLVPERVESNLPIATILDDGSVLCSGDITKNDVFTITLPASDRTVTAIRLEALTHPNLPGGGPGRQTTSEGPGGEGSFFLSEIEARLVDALAPEGESSTALKWGAASDTYASEEKNSSLAIDGKHDTGWAIFGGEGQRQSAVFRFEVPVEISSDQWLQVRLCHENYYASALGRFRISVTSQSGELEATGFTDEEIEALLASEDQNTEQQTELLRERFLLTAPALKNQHEQLAALKRSLPEFPTALVMQQRDAKHPRQTHRHHRGEYLQPKEPVTPGVLEILHDLPSDEKPDRLTLARWLVDRENPLVARVVMNRHWEAFFGRGLVRTTEDFGYQGEYPSHPALLDWLAVEFMDSGWSLKHMHKLIVMSATYRQSSAVTPLKLEVDPENKLLSRGPSFRVEAELLRDVVLASGGLLSAKIGGPSVFPPQPPGITEAAYGALNWTVSPGEDRYRRGLYTFNKRTAPYAAFGLFDAPSGEVCVPRRSRSNTPLQSLAMLNDQVVLESARNMAIQGMHEHGADRDALAIELFRRCVTRPPEENELESVLAFQLNQHRRLIESSLDANRILNTGPTFEWQFEQEVGSWQARNQVGLEIAEDQLVVKSTGEDPQLSTEVSSLSGPHVLTIHALAESAGTAELFWTTEKKANEAPERRVSFDLKPNEWRDYTVSLNADSPLRSIRLDPDSKPGVIRIKRIRLACGDGLVEIPAGIDRVEIASWMLTARVLLNLDETITKP